MVLEKLGYMHAFSPLIALTANVICQVFVSRYVTGFSLLRAVFIGFALGICSLFFIELFYLSQTSLSLLERVSSIFANLITYSALGYGYFHFTNLGETARRIRILRELYDSKGGLSMEGIVARYNPKEMLKRRISRLLNSGQIVFREGRLYIGKPSVLYMAKIMVMLKLLFFGKASEFD